LNEDSSLHLRDGHFALRIIGKVRIGSLIEIQKVALRLPHHVEFESSYVVQELAQGHYVNVSKAETGLEQQVVKGVKSVFVDLKRQFELKKVD
jgi:hypothetical protein